MKSIKILALAVIGLLALYVVSVYMSHFYYRKPAYTLGIKNASQELIRGSSLTLSPTGGFIFGSLSPGQKAVHMDPSWPVPKSIDLKFEDEDGASHELTVPTGLTESFKGQILVEVALTEDTFSALVQTNAP
ncbi:MAG: hypothetical protein MUC91_01855 [Verrucomicrobia bacterium]|jgi:hypothetical protein|nr:hypothetical protein [Verrucomicrobiota bacterium]